MKTTLKRGMGRGAAVNGNGRSVYPPGVHTPMKRYRQPEPRRRDAWQLVRSVVLWVIVVAVIVASGVAGAAFSQTFTQSGGIGATTGDPGRHMPKGVLVKVGKFSPSVGIREFLHWPYPG